MEINFSSDFNRHLTSKVQFHLFLCLTTENIDMKSINGTIDSVNIQTPMSVASSICGLELASIH